jgi:transposase
MKEKKMQTEFYSSDLTEVQWRKVEDVFKYSDKAEYGNQAEYDRRYLLNAVSFWLHCGRHWGMLPHDFPPAATVRSFYYRISKGGWRSILGSIGRELGGVWTEAYTSKREIARKATAKKEREQRNAEIEAAKPKTALQRRYPYANRS